MPGNAFRPGPLRLLFAAACLSGWTGASLAQVPDNRGVYLDPEDPVSPAYRETLDRRDRHRLDAAHERGSSFLPIFQGEGRMTAESSPGADSRAGRGDRAPADGGIVSGARTTVASRTPPVTRARPEPVYEAVEGVSPRAGSGDGLTAMLDVLLETWNWTPTVVRLRYPRMPDRAGRDASRPERIPDSGAADGRGDWHLPPIAPGDGFYARTLHAVDSDYPGPAVLELLQPPLAGAVATGAFELVREHLVLRLTRLAWRGATVPVDAWAVGLDCACYGLEGDVDRHWLERLAFPAAVRFAEGFLTAAGLPERTLTLDGAAVHERRRSTTRRDLFAGLSAAVRTAGDILLQDAPDRPTVRIPRDTELIVMFAAAPGGEGRHARQ